MEELESKTKEAIRKLITDRGGYWANVTGGAYSKRGDPDILACYKGHFIGIEGKTYEGSLSGWQKTRKKQILKAGGLWIKAHTTEDVSSLLDWIDSNEE